MARVESGGDGVRDREVEVGVGGYVEGEVVQLCYDEIGGNADDVTQLQLIGVPDLRVAWTPAADLRLEANLGAITTEGAAATATLSWSFPVSKVTRLGVWAGGIGVADSDFSGGNVLVAGGLAASFAWSKVGLDLNVPVYSWGVRGGGLGLFSALGSQAELTFALGKGHALRAGLVSALPGVGWQWAGDRWLARAELHTIGVMTLVQGEVGARF